MRAPAGSDSIYLRSGAKGSLRDERGQSGPDTLFDTCSAIERTNSLFKPDGRRIVHRRRSKFLDFLSTFRLYVFEPGLTIVFFWWLFQHVLQELRGR
jgi:hypothetical protein